MKKVFVSIAVLSAASSFTSCSKKPKADFTINGSSFSVGDTIVVENKSKNSNGTSWAVYDGTNTNGPGSEHVRRISGNEPCAMNFSFTLDTTGTYTLSAKADNWKKSCNESPNSGKYDEQTFTIVVQ